PAFKIPEKMTCPSDSTWTHTRPTIVASIRTPLILDAVGVGAWATPRRGRSVAVAIGAMVGTGVAAEVDEVGSASIVGTVANPIAVAVGIGVESINWLVSFDEVSGSDPAMKATYCKKR